MKRLAAVLLGAVLALQAAPAQADDYTGPADLLHPLYRPAGDAGLGDTIVQLEAPRRAWGARQVARRWDELIDGLTILTTGTCAERPDAACIQLTIAPYDQAAMDAAMGQPGSWWNGLCYCDQPTSRQVILNSYNSTRYPGHALVWHELGHALGLGHHEGPGVTADTRTTRPSEAELALLREWYAGVHVSGADLETQP